MQQPFSLSLSFLVVANHSSLTFIQVAGSSSTSYHTSNQCLSVPGNYDNLNGCSTQSHMLQQQTTLYNESPVAHTLNFALYLLSLNSTQLNSNYLIRSLYIVSRLTDTWSKFNPYFSRRHFLPFVAVGSLYSYPPSTSNCSLI